MSNKKILMEVNIFAKLLSLFYDKQASGKSDELEKQINISGDKSVKVAYDAWKKSSDDMLDATRRMLVKAGKDTSKIDDLIKKYR
jgi:hypothetical protein